MTVVDIINSNNFLPKLFTYHIGLEFEVLALEISQTEKGMTAQRDRNDYRYFIGCSICFALHLLLLTNEKSIVIVTLCAVMPFSFCEISSHYSKGYTNKIQIFDPKFDPLSFAKLSIEGVL